MVLEEGSRGSFDVILQGTKREGLTLGEAARRFATSELCPQLVGTAESIADHLTDLFESHACDGFVLTPTTFPGMYEQFCRIPWCRRCSGAAFSARSTAARRCANIFGKAVTIDGAPGSQHWTPISAEVD